jgi:hypothetical protein
MLENGALVSHTMADLDPSIRYRTALSKCFWIRNDIFRFRIIRDQDPALGGSDLNQEK